MTLDDIRKKGAVVVWLTADTTPTPPPEIKAYFPDLVPEVPRTFARPVQGRLPLLRIGWGVIRPGSVAAAASRRKCAVGCGLLRRCAPRSRRMSYDGGVALRGRP